MNELTFKDLKKRISLETTLQQFNLFERLQNKPFWIWDLQQHKLQDIRMNGNCCFNHMIGLPQICFISFLPIIVFPITSIHSASSLNKEPNIFGS